MKNNLKELGQYDNAIKLIIESLFETKLTNIRYDDENWPFTANIILYLCLSWGKQIINSNKSHTYP